MADWPISLHLQDDKRPLYRRIAATISCDIGRGRLRPGERLPSSRNLAKQLGVNRNTVVAAYEELRVEAWIVVEPARGTFVADRSQWADAAQKRATEKPTPSRPGFDLRLELVGDIPIARAPGTLLMLGGVPDLRFLPHKQIASAYRSALRGRDGKRLLDYGDPQGNPALRRAIGDLLAKRRAVVAPPESICTVRGSQQGMYLAAKALIEPGDVVAVESYGYCNAWQALRLAGASLQPIRVDRDGIDVSELAALCERKRVRAVLVTPHHQYPTGVALSPTRRRALLKLATSKRMIVFEDDYDFDFHYDAQPILPLASEDDGGVVVYFGTLSKSLAPGLRLGYVVAPSEVIRRITAYRTYVDCQGDHALEQAIATLLQEGVVQRHADRALREYRLRRDVLCAALERSLPNLDFVTPRGGMAVWARAPGIDTDAWVERALDAGAAIQAASRFTFDGSRQCFVRIGFAACNRRELTRGVRTLAATVKSAAQQVPTSVVLSRRLDRQCG